MKETMQAILRAQHVIAADHPDLADEAAREAFAVELAKSGLELSYDPQNGTVTLLIPDHEEAYSNLERATLLVCWAHFEHRAHAYRSSPQEDRIPVLTEEKAAEIRSQKTYSLKAAQLAKDFPNLYPQPNVAASALNSLVDRHILLKSSDTYYAGPLLRHVVDPQEARALIEGELRGHFEDLKPAEDAAESHREQILAVLRLVEEGQATKKVITDRIEKPWRILKREIDALVEGGMVEAQKAGSGRYYRLAKKGTGTGG